MSTTAGSTCYLLRSTVSSTLVYFLCHTDYALLVPGMTTWVGDEVLMKIPRTHLSGFEAGHASKIQCVGIAKHGLSRWLNAASHTRAFRSNLISRFRHTISHSRITRTFCLVSLPVVNPIPPLRMRSEPVVPYFPSVISTVIRSIMLSARRHRDDQRSE